MAIHPNALQPRDNARVAVSPRPQEDLLSPFCSAEHLKACTLDFPCGLCTKRAINSQFSIQGNFSSEKFYPRVSAHFDGHLTSLQPHSVNQLSCDQHLLHTSWRNKHTNLIFQVQPLPMRFWVFCGFFSFFFFNKNKQNTHTKQNKQNLKNTQKQKSLQVTLENKELDHFS